MFHWNDMVMIYDGSEFKAILNGQKKVVPLIGNSSLINKPRTYISKPELHPSPPPSLPKNICYKQSKSLIQYFSNLENSLLSTQ